MAYCAAENDPRVRWNLPRNAIAKSRRPIYCCMAYWVRFETQTNRQTATRVVLFPQVHNLFEIQVSCSKKLMLFYGKQSILRYDLKGKRRTNRRLRWLPKTYNKIWQICTAIVLFNVLYKNERLRTKIFQRNITFFILQSVIESKKSELYRCVWKNHGSKLNFRSKFYYFFYFTHLYILISLGE